ncbi:hypothetical protein Ancab_020697 [Ancistrocladus abbreviatus]
MSNQKKRNFQIEAFKHRVVVDPKYAEKTWKILEHAIHEIYNHNASGLSFEELYRLGLKIDFDRAVGIIKQLHSLHVLQSDCRFQKSHHHSLSH